MQEVSLGVDIVDTILLHVLSNLHFLFCTLFNFFLLLFAIPPTILPFQDIPRNSDEMQSIILLLLQEFRQRQ